MIIRKQFKFFGQHIVRNCSSDRCKKSIHGHTYIVEVFFKGDQLDNGYMIMDFGLMKETIKKAVMVFNKSYSMWDQEPQEFQDHIQATRKRVVTMPLSPSAESYSIVIFEMIQRILQNTTFTNGENSISLDKVKVHETATGYAEYKGDMMHPTGNRDIDMDIVGKMSTHGYDEKDTPKYLTNLEIQNPQIHPQIIDLRFQ